MYDSRCRIIFALFLEGGVAKSLPFRCGTAEQPFVSRCVVQKASERLRLTSPDTYLLIQRETSGHQGVETESEGEVSKCRCSTHYKGALLGLSLVGWLGRQNRGNWISLDSRTQKL